MHVTTLGNFPLIVSINVLVSLKGQDYGVCSFVATLSRPDACCVENVLLRGLEYWDESTHHKLPMQHQRHHKWWRTAKRGCSSRRSCLCSGLFSKCRCNLLWRWHFQDPKATDPQDPRELSVLLLKRRGDWRRRLYFLCWSDYMK